MVIPKKGAAHQAPLSHGKLLPSTCCGPGTGVRETWGAAGSCPSKCPLAVPPLESQAPGLHLSPGCCDPSHFQIYQIELESL